MAEFSSPVIAVDGPPIALEISPSSKTRSAIERVTNLCRTSLGKMLAATFLAGVCILSASLLINSTVQAQQGGTTTYVYDEDGRLHAVLSPDGQAAVYEYDGAGNFTAIRRLTPNDLELLSFNPHQGPIGTRVTIFGTGFNQGITSVSFNGVTATIVNTNLVSVSALVPQGATTGPISVVTPRGTINTTTPFIVRGILLSPQAITLPAAGSVQFDAVVSGAPTGNVIWSVNGVEGGTLNTGTISGGGFYAAPSLAGGTSVQFTVRATSADDAELFGEAVVTVVPIGAGYEIRSDGLSVRYGTPPNNQPTEINNALSVRYGTPSNNQPTYINDAVSVRYGTPTNTPPTFVNGAVSVSRGPVLLSLSPGTIARGSTVTLTLDGIALDGTTSLTFFRLTNGNPENGITISNINVNAQGTSLTATITVASNVATGGYVVVVTTPIGSTVRNDATTNTVQIN
jgi:YD repeat-containing protein